VHTLKNDPVNVLFTSAGRRVELLQEFRRAYRELGLDGTIVITDVDPLAPTLKVADRHYLVPPNTTPDYVPALVDICERENISAVFPLIDPDILILSEHRAEIEASGAKLGVVSDHAAKITRDKWLTYHFFQEINLPTPETWALNEIEDVQCKYPLFIKPRSGSAGKHAFRVDNDEQLAFFKNYVANPLIQSFIDGVEITSDAICNLKGEILGISQRQRIEVRAGEVAKGKTVFHQSVLEDCTRIARMLPAVGPITIQCILKDDVPYYTEINARMGGGLPLGIAAGVDAPKWLLADLAGIALERPPLGTYQLGLHMTRFDDSFFLTEEHIGELARSHI
jgi:carbamoyl-phosphate synthase large subunit